MGAGAEFGELKRSLDFGQASARKPDTGDIGHIDPEHEQDAKDCEGKQVLCVFCKLTIVGRQVINNQFAC